MVSFFFFINFTNYLTVYFFLDENKKKTSSKLENEPEMMEIDVNTKVHKQSLFVDLPKEIELKISDSTIEQQVTI